MNLWKSIRKIDWPHLIGFALMMLKRPLLIYPIYKATQHTLSVSSELYGNAHFKNGPANAFRHAYWNVCISNAIYKRKGDAELSVKYCEEIVKYYEKSTKNLPMDHSMDYHNNQVGRKVFMTNLELNSQKMIEILQNMAKNAQKVIELKDFAKYENSLVYLQEDEVQALLPKN